VRLRRNALPHVLRRLVKVAAESGLLFIFSVATCVCAYAHHSFATHYLVDQPMEITGTVSELSLRSPHSFLMVDVRSEQGVVERWEVEAHAVPLMRRLGIEADTIQLGDEITVRGPGPRRTDKKLMFAAVLILADGTQFTLLDSLLSDLNRGLTEDSSDTLPADAGILERIGGRWGRSSGGGSGTQLGDSPLPLNSAGLSARAAYDPRNTPAMDCISPGLPSLLYAPYLYEIQINGQEAILHHEYQTVFRSVDLGGGTVGPDSRPQFGYRTGRVDGNVLVVESRGFPAEAAGLASDWDPNGLGANVPSSGQKRLIEKYTVSEDGQRLILDYTVEDPAYLSEPYSSRIEWRRLVADAPIYDFECDVSIATRSTLNAPAKESSN